MRFRLRLLHYAIIAVSLLAAGFGSYREARLQEPLEVKAKEMGIRLSVYSQQLEQRADAQAQYIGYAVNRNRNQARDMELLRQTERIVKRAESLTDSLGQLCVAIVLTDKRASSFSLAAVMGTPGAIWKEDFDSLEYHLNSYVAFIRQYVPNNPSLTQVGPSPAETGEFSRFYFQNTSEDVVIANLRRLITEVRQAEVDAILSQAVKVGSPCLSFDVIRALAVPTSFTVAPGTTYEAKLFLAESFSRFYYKEMCVNGQKVKRIDYEQGMVEIPFLVAPSEVAELPDTVRWKWQGTIRTSFYPADTTWSITVPYSIIVRP
ncbi:MAG TPA: hypothetical protein VF629_23410 [Hymenobacter sp.]|jgi:hypothetical protein|uniref:hypothetical protein n=1 Tax=Hymenobacter sp. TaxID=1898978 RepID=UPI002ED982FC